MIEFNDELWDKMLNIAQEVSKKAVLVKSTNQVGVAVLMDSGRIYAGANYESYNHNAIVHGEQSAIAHALNSEPKGTKVLALRIVSMKYDEISFDPCGGCRDFIWTISNEQMDETHTEHIKIWTKSGVKTIEDFYPMFS